MGITDNYSVTLTAEIYKFWNIWNIISIFVKNIFAVWSPDFSVLAKSHLHEKLIANSMLFETYLDAKSTQL